MKTFSFMFVRVIEIEKNCWVGACDTVTNKNIMYIINPSRNYQFVFIILSVRVFVNLNYVLYIIFYFFNLEYI